METDRRVVVCTFPINESKFPFYIVRISLLNVLCLIETYNVVDIIYATSETDMDFT